MSDDDIENDFDTDDFDDGGFDDLNSQKGSLGDLWRNNPIVKIGIIAFGVVFIVGGIFLFGGEVDTLPESQISPVQDVTEAPGKAEISETMRQAVEEETVRRTEEAVRGQGSAMPTPIDPPKGVIGLQFEEEEEEDPLERWRRMQQERIAQQQIQAPKVEPQVPEPPPVDTRTPAINAMSQAMSQQMATILDAQDFNGPIVKQVSGIDYLDILAEKEQEKLAKKLEMAAVAEQQITNSDSNQDLNIIVPAGTIEYAQMITEANTDAPGPILAQIVSGPLKGGRMIGTFQSTDHYLTLNFNTVVLDGIDFAAEGIAIDPSTTLPGVVTDIDRRYFTRVLLPAAAEFIEGFTEAIADSGTTTITINGTSTTTTTSNANTTNDQEVASGIEKAGEEIGEILGKIADDTKPLLRVRAGTPIGILFISPVVGTPQLLQKQEEEAFERERVLQQLSSPFNYQQQ
jgi:intracellular multiplication protein IcmE